MTSTGRSPAAVPAPPWGSVGTHTPSHACIAHLQDVWDLRQDTLQMRLKSRLSTPQFLASCTPDSRPTAAPSGLFRDRQKNSALTNAPSECSDPLKAEAHCKTDRLRFSGMEPPQKAFSAPLNPQSGQAGKRHLVSIPRVSFDRHRDRFWPKRNSHKARV